MRLNEGMPHKLRQELLLPFVTQLAGTADQRIVERGREDFITTQHVRRLFSLVCREVFERHDLSHACSHFTTTTAAINKACAVIRWANASGYKPLRCQDLFQSHLYLPKSNKTLQRTYFTIATQILEEEILLGNHEPTGDLAEVNKRLEAAKQAARRRPVAATAEPVPDVATLTVY
jgi:hypothetical protein